MTADPAPLQQLAADPAAFDFDAAVRLLLHRAGTADPAAAARFTSRAGLAFAPADVLGVELPPDDGPAPVAVGLLGLLGSAGVLPRRYTEDAASDDGAALHALFDLLAHRMLAALARAGGKYRLDRGTEAARLANPAAPPRTPHAQALLGVAGFGEPGVTARLPFGEQTLLHYAGTFALRPRSADRLAALASDWLGRPVTVIEFQGTWLPIEPDQRSRLPTGRDSGRFAGLGRDAALGTRAWDPQARIVLRIGPLDRAAFEALLPDAPALTAFVALIRAYLGFEVGFAVNLVLAAAEVPATQLAPHVRPGPRLGWNTWLGRAGGYVRRGDAADARFAAETVERRPVAG
jgi:type VI secretion system protein ImpH